MPASHGVDFHPDFQQSHNIRWEQVPDYPLMFVKFTESRHVGTYEAAAARDFLIMRDRKEQGLHQFIGGYFWLTSYPVVDQVDNFLRFVRQYIGGFEPGETYQLDWETTDYAPHLTPSAEQAWEFRERVLDRIGVECITYCSDWMPDSTIDQDLRGEFYEWREQHPTAPLWYANYSLSTGSTGGPAEVAKYGADVWQWSSTAYAPGFPTPVDMNEIMPKGWDTLRRICRLEQPAQPTPTPGPAPTEADAMKHITADGREPALVGAGFVHFAQDDEERYVMTRLHGEPVVLNAREYDVYLTMATTNDQ